MIRLSRQHIFHKKKTTFKETTFKRTCVETIPVSLFLDTNRWKVVLTGDVPVLGESRRDPLGICMNLFCFSTRARRWAMEFVSLPSLFSFTLTFSISDNTVCSKSSTWFVLKHYFINVKWNVWCFRDYKKFIISLFLQLRIRGFRGCLQLSLLLGNL